MARDNLRPKHAHVQALPAVGRVWIGNCRSDQADPLLHFLCCLPVFTISDYDDNGTEAKALARGAWKFVPKPLDFAQLKPDVIEVIAKARGGG